MIKGSYNYKHQFFNSAWHFYFNLDQIKNQDLDKMIRIILGSNQILDLDQDQIKDTDLWIWIKVGSWSGTGSEWDHDQEQDQD